MTNVLGSITTYTGDEIPGLKGRRVRVVAILRGAALPGVDVDADDYYVTDEDALARLGGITAADRVDAQPFDRRGRQSFVHVDPRAVDLDAFKHLANANQR